MYRIEFDPTYCSKCGACYVTCMDQNDIDPAKSKVTLENMDPGKRMAGCKGCEERVLDGRKPACVLICPTGALTMRTEN